MNVDSSKMPLAGFVFCGNESCVTDLPSNMLMRSHLDQDIVDNRL